MEPVSLNREAIFRAALRLVDAEGLTALTMRRLAADLGVATMSLYSHVLNKDVVVLGMVDMATAEMRLPSRDTPAWDALRAITREFRRVALLHPNLVPLIALSPPAGPEALRTLEAGLDALRRAGIDPARTARGYRMMASFAIGFVSLETGGYFRPVKPEGGGAQVDLGPLDATPTILEVAPYLAEWDRDEEFEAGMDGIIAFLSSQMSRGDPTGE